MFIPVPPNTSLPMITANATAIASIQSGTSTGTISGMSIPDHYAGIVFAGLIVFMLIMEWVKPEERNIHENAPVDMTPWKYAKAAGAVLLAAVVTFYVLLAR